MNEGMWSTAEYLTKNTSTPVKRAEKELYRSLFELQPKAGGLLQSWGWGHTQYVWDVRSYPKVATVFEELYKTSDLLLYLITLTIRDFIKERITYTVITVVVARIGILYVLQVRRFFGTADSSTLASKLSSHQTSHQSLLHYLAAFVMLFIFA